MDRWIKDREKMYQSIEFKNICMDFATKYIYICLNDKRMHTKLSSFGDMDLHTQHIYV